MPGKALSATASPFVSIPKSRVSSPKSHVSSPKSFSSLSDASRESLRDPNVAVVKLPTGDEIIVNLTNSKPSHSSGFDPSPYGQDTRPPLAGRTKTEDSVPSLQSLRSTGNSKTNDSPEERPSVSDARKKSKSRAEMIQKAHSKSKKDGKRISKRQDRCKTWETEKISSREKYLIGKKVIGRISPCRNGRYFVKWHRDPRNTVTISQSRVESQIGDVLRPNLLVAVTIKGLGPDHVRWDRKHPFAAQIEVADEKSQDQRHSRRNSKRLPKRINTPTQEPDTRPDRLKFSGSKLRQTV